MDTSVDTTMILSDDAVRSWEEEVENAVSNAINRRPSTDTPTAPSQDDVQTSVETQAVEIAEETPNYPTGGDETYIGELLVSAKVSAADTFKVCLDLKSNLKSEIISIDHSIRGTTIKCTVPNPAALIGSMYKLSGISAWALTAQ